MTTRHPRKPATTLRRVGTLCVLLAAAALIWCKASPPHEEEQEEEAAAARRPSDPPQETRPTMETARRLHLRILHVYPHDPRAFTQGLVWDRGGLWESTGLYGRSSLRRVELETGRVTREVPIDVGHFAEGLALVDDPHGRRLVQLTWQKQEAFVWDPRTLTRRGDLSYEGEGWGLCWDGRRLVRSDGSDNLIFHDAESFVELGRVRVTLDGHPLASLNELECVGGMVYANVWMSDQIVRIDPETGRVDQTIDASGLLTPSERARADVLNGIAYRPETGTLLVTGKLWPELFEVEAVEEGFRDSSPP